MRELPFDHADRRLAAAAWTRIAEPEDTAAGVLCTHLGPDGALDWLCHVARHGVSGPLAPPLPAGGIPPGHARQPWEEAVARWAPRLDTLDIRRELATIDSLGGRLVVPWDEEWPAAVDELAERAPAALWVRGRGRLDVPGRAVAVVGMRASTAYGEHVAASLGIDLAERGVAVVSGGAYGIDAAAHRGSLSVGGPTCAVLAGGVDRLYPSGNTALLEAVMDRGVVLSEPPPGSAHQRHRFLARNRLIAALGQVCVVVEAAWRSGALSTARHAADLLRPVGAVPGPVTSMGSAGCHRLLRETDAVCVTGSADVLELLAPSGEDLGADPDVPVTLLDGLDPLGARILDALPAKATANLPSLARAAGLSEHEVRTGLGRLELGGRVERSGAGWRRSRADRTGARQTGA